jgi:sugar/nucleoside kinase (ribokinase family)
LSSSEPGKRGGPGGKSLDLVVIGDCNPDVLVLGGDVTPAFGQQEKLVDSMTLAVGGSAAITAVAAARLGLSVALVAAVGADAAGEFMLGELGRAGVDTSAVAVREAAPTGMTVALSRGGDRAILTALGAIGSLTAADVPAALLARARHVHTSSYFLLASSLGPGLAAVLAAARAAGASTSLDTNWDPSGRWADEHLRAVLAQVDLLLPNKAEALRLAGWPDQTSPDQTSPGQRAPAQTAPDLAAAGRVLTAGGARLVVKLGPPGALCIDGTRTDQVGLPPVTPVDETGAGDCFNAGLIAGLAAGLPLPDAAALGCATGALSTGAPGGTGSCPDLATAQALAKTATISTQRST